MEDQSSGLLRWKRSVNLTETNSELAAQGVFHSVPLGVPGRVSFSHGRALCRKVAHCVIASKHRRLFSYSSIKHEARRFGAGITEHFTEKLCETTSKSVLKVLQPVCRCSKKKTPNQFGSDLAPRLTFPSSQHTLILSSPPMKRTDASKVKLHVVMWWSYLEYSLSTVLMKSLISFSRHHQPDSCLKHSASFLSSRDT